MVDLRSGHEDRFAAGRQLWHRGRSSGRPSTARPSRSLPAGNFVRVRTSRRRAGRPGQVPPSHLATSRRQLGARLHTRRAPKAPASSRSAGKGGHSRRFPIVPLLATSTRSGLRMVGRSDARDLTGGRRSPMRTLPTCPAAIGHPPPRRLEHTPHPRHALGSGFARRRLCFQHSYEHGASGCRVACLWQHDRLAAHRAVPAVDHAHPPSRPATDRGQRRAAPYLNPGTAPADNVGVGRAWRWRPTEPGSAHTQARVKRRTARCPARARAATAPRARVPGRPTPTPARSARGVAPPALEEAIGPEGLDPRATLSCGRSSANPGQKRCRPAAGPASGRMVGQTIPTRPPTNRRQGCLGWPIAHPSFTHSVGRRATLADTADPPPD